MLVVIAVLVVFVVLVLVVSAGSVPVSGRISYSRLDLGHKTRLYLKYRNPKFRYTSYTCLIDIAISVDEWF